ncbi:T9SS type A sorting domain-containing protein [Flavicella marina]|uniref:T9SS type A sorting domain-containing protein n=1 Tax=Flavicella marina TaxID=1475951 RepID=UPI00126552F9|nr:T9SS type A sorting domain-containing protein [Flavicella marina]
MLKTSRRIKWILSAIAFIVLSTNLKAQQKIELHVSPTIDTSIKGHLNFERKKYINLATSSQEITRRVKSDRIDHYYKDLEMGMGRALGMIYSETRWGNALREDSNRPGYADIEYLKSQSNPNDGGLNTLKTLLGANQDLALHDRHSAYPEFMESYTKEDVHGQNFPTNNDAASELVANFLKYKYTDFQRPAYFELVNEPHWRFWDDDRFHAFHTETKKKVDAMNVPTQIGGPCYSVSYFYKNDFNNINQIVKFIDKTNFELDFYSFHTYDYMKWDVAKKDFVGSVTSGLPLESVFDALASYTYNKYGKEFSYVASEHGGYLSDTDNRNLALDYLADTYFPGEGFEHEMEKRSISNFIMVNSAISNTMTFMEHPHIVKKAVPFILIESSNWDPYYYSSLLVKENFDKNSPNYAESKLIHFFKLFEDVKGRRIESFSKDSDIQQQAFVNDNQLIILLHNQSDVEGTIHLNIDPIDKNSITSYKVKELKRKVDFRPEFTETTFSTLDEVTISPQGSTVVFVNYINTIHKQKEINQHIYYSNETAAKFTGSKSFTVNIPEYKKAKYGILRIGIDRDINLSKEVVIKLNNKTLEVLIEDSADRMGGDDDYATTKIIKVPGDMLKENNTVEVLFPDGKEGGVGAVVIRAGLDEQEISTTDSDGDGVFDGYDNCPNTKKGVLVNEYGCPLINGNTNFTIQTFGETCPGEANAKISIRSKIDVACSVILNNTQYDFNKEIIIDNLSADTYDLCVSVNGQDEKNCYKVQLEKSELLKAAIKKEKNSVSYQIEKGTAPYRVYINKSLAYTTSLKQFEVGIKPNDILELTSCKTCEGTINTGYDNQIFVYPNPSKGTVQIDTSAYFGENIEFSLVDASGKTIRSKMFKAIEQNPIYMDYSAVPKGYYFINILVNGALYDSQKLILN